MCAEANSFTKPWVDPGAGVEVGITHPKPFSFQFPVGKAICSMVPLPDSGSTPSITCTVAHYSLVTWNDDISESQHGKVVRFKAFLKQILGKHHCKGRQGCGELVRAQPTLTPSPHFCCMKHTLEFLGGGVGMGRQEDVDRLNGKSPSGTTDG